jgi:hypothetical protein
MQKNVTGQKWIVFAFNRTTNVPLTGDAAQITGNLRLDGGAANAIDDTNPTELEDGYYVFDITQAETNGNMILISPESSTGDIQVIGTPAALYTTAPNFNTLGIESDGDITKINLCANTTLVDTTTTNTDMVGTDSAATASALATAQLDLDTLTGADGAIIASGTQTFDITGSITGNVSGSIGSVTAEVTADMTKINGVSASAVNLEQGAFALQTGAAITGTLTTTAMTTNLTETTDDHYNGRIITWTSGVLDKQATDITDYVGSTKSLIFTAVTEAPSNTDTFVIS